MANYTECEFCGASLDFGERCDCQSRAEKDGSDYPTEQEIKSAIGPAEAKLARIIQREGDANGERLKPYYLAMLISEHIQQQRMAAKCKEKRRIAEANTPLPNNTIIAF